MRREPSAPPGAKPVAAARAARSQLRVSLRAALKSNREARVAERLGAVAEAAQRPPRWRPSRGIAAPCRAPLPDLDSGPVVPAPEAEPVALAAAECAPLSQAEPEPHQEAGRATAEPAAAAPPAPVPGDTSAEAAPSEPASASPVDTCAPAAPQPIAATSPTPRSRPIPRWHPRRRTVPSGASTAVPAPAPPAAGETTLPAMDAGASIFAGLLNDLATPRADAQGLSPALPGTIAEALQAEGETVPEAVTCAASSTDACLIKAIAPDVAPLEATAGEITAAPGEATPIADALAECSPSASTAPVALLGPGMMARLRLLGFTCFEDLAGVEPSALRHALGDISRLLNVEAWVLEARRQVAAQHGDGRV